MKPGMNPNQLLSGLKGAPAAIFLALVLHGGPQTVKHVCSHTAYSDKVVRQGLARLEEMGLAFFDPDFHAWYLEPQTALLCWLQNALGAPTAENRPAAHAEEALSTELSTELSTGGAAEEKITAAREDSTNVEEETTAGHKRGADKTAVGESPVKEDSTAEAEESSTFLEISSAAAEDITNGKEKNTAASDLLLITTTSTNPTPRDQVVVSKQTTRPKKRVPEAGRRRREKILMDWLVRGGIGGRSPKMRELLASDLDLETVKAHVLERLAWEAGHIREGPPYKAGLLIHKLLSGDPPPPMRCEVCLRLPNKQGLCSCDYEILMQR